MSDLNSLLAFLAANPQVTAAVLAVLYNLAGYFLSMLKIKAFENYDKAKLLETLILFETLFTILQTVGGLPPAYVTAITVISAILVNLKDKISAYVKLAKPLT